MQRYAALLSWHSNTREEIKNTRMISGVMLEHDQLKGYSGHFIKQILLLQFLQCPTTSTQFDWLEVT